MIPLLALALAMAPPLASAGTADAPEVSDPTGDATCFGPAGNLWSDIDAAWVSGETADAFDVNLRLSQWTHEALSTVTGFTLQFTHQGKQFGVAAIYVPPPVDSGWEFSNGYIDLESQELRDFSDATGSFSAGPPAVLTVRFDKTHFPHVDASDNRLVDFKGGSADLKNQIPSFLLPVPPQPFQVCDLVASDAVYEFQVGDHTGHAGMPADGRDATETEAPATMDEVAPATASPESPTETPAPGLALVALGAAFAALRLRRRS